MDLRPVFYVVRGSVCWSAIHSPVPRPNRRLSSKSLNFRRVTHGRTPRIAECLRISRLRRPFAKKAFRRFSFGLVKKETETVPPLDHEALYDTIMAGKSEAFAKVKRLARMMLKK